MHPIKKLAKFMTTFSFVLILSNGAALAIPSLQLDIKDGIYDNSADVQTIIATTNPFTLYAFLIPDNNNPLTDQYYISGALVPKVSISSNLGSFTFNGSIVNVTSNMIYGVPPLESALGNQGFDSGDLQKHGIFETYFKEFGPLTFSSLQQISQYNTQDRAIAGDPIPSTGTGMYYLTFQVDVTNLSPDYIIHFDLYNIDVLSATDTDIVNNGFAPFTHDAQSNGHEVPEPTTLILLGSGLVWIGLSGRSKFKGPKS